MTILEIEYYEYKKGIFLYSKTISGEALKKQLKEIEMIYDRENDNFIDNEIILLDTMGELSKLFSICHIAFIGGSFSTTGGHNPLEANIWSKPVISGPCTFNFKDVYRTVTQLKCAVIVNTEQEFKSELISFYKDNEKYEQYCKNAQKVFEENKGAINFVLERI